MPSSCSGNWCPPSEGELYVTEADGTGQRRIYTQPYPSEPLTWGGLAFHAEWNWADGRIYFVQADNKWHRKAVPYGGSPVHYSEWEAAYTQNFICPVPGPGNWSPVLCYRGQNVWSIDGEGGSLRVELPNKTTNPADSSDPTWWNRTCANPDSNQRRCRMLTNLRARSTEFLYARNNSNGSRLTGGDLSESDPGQRVFYPSLFGADMGTLSPSFSQMVYTASGYHWRISMSDGTKLKQLTLTPREWGFARFAKLSQLPRVQACGLAEFANNGDEASGEEYDVHAGFGFFERHETDLQLGGGIDVPFAFERSYSSGCTGGSDLGSGGGWRHSFESSLTVGENGDVTAISPSGQRLVFTKNADGSYTPAPGGGASTLVKLASTYELSLSDRTVHVYSLAGQFQQIRTRNGKTITLAYQNGRLASITDTVGRVVTITRNPFNRISSIALPDGRQVAYTYDTDGHLASVTDPRGKTWLYEYTYDGLLNRVVDPRGNDEARVAYDGTGRVITRTDALGQTTNFSWDSVRQTATITDAAGQQTTKVFNNNLLVAETDPLGNKTSYGYDDNFNQTSVVDPRGNETTMTYDARGNLLTRTLPGPQPAVESFTYTATNERSAAMDPLGHITHYSYDANGNLIETSFPDGTSIQTTYSDGLPTAMTDQRGKTWTYEYDNHGNRTAVISPLGYRRSFQYDLAGRLTAEISPEGNQPGADPADYATAYGYDAADHKLSETDPLGNQTSWQYDPVGNLAATTDPNDHTTSYSYDAANRLITTTAPDGSTTTNGYDVVGNLTSRTDANDHTTSYAYDAAGRRTSLTDPLGNQWVYSFDPNGNLTTVNPPGGGTITSAYDEVNRLIQVSYSDGTPTVSYSYDANGNRTEMTDGAGSQTYSYDALNRLTEVSRGGDSFNYSYDEAGNLIARDYPGASHAYGYDDDNRLAEVAVDGTVATYGYDAAGRQTELTLPNGYTEARNYDQAGRAVRVTNADANGVLSRYEYSYDPSGQATSIVTQDGVEKYTYDSQGRLTKACYQASCPNPADPHISYTYDPVGNRLIGATSTGTTSYSYNAADQLTETTGPGGTTSYGYDERGNQTQAGDRSFVFNLPDKITSISEGSSTIVYSYDGDGNRLEADGPEGTTRYLWDVNNEMPHSRSSATVPAARSAPTSTARPRSR